jgi:hypothetical protein
LKILLFTWRLIKNRLPTKENLEKKFVIADAKACLGGCG